MSSHSDSKRYPNDDVDVDHTFEGLNSTSPTSRNDSSSGDNTNRNRLFNPDTLNYKDQLREVQSARSRQRIDEQKTDIAEIDDLNNDRRNPAGLNFKDQVLSSREEIQSNDRLYERTQKNQTSRNNAGEGQIGAIHVTPPFSREEQNADENEGDNGNESNDSPRRNLNERTAQRSAIPNETIEPTDTPFVPEAYVVEHPRSVIVADSVPSDNRNPLLRWASKHPYLIGVSFVLFLVILVGIVVTAFNVLGPSDSTVSPSKTPSVMLSESPSNQPSMVPMSSICFLSGDELRTAVKEYFSPNNDSVRSKYGKTIGSWCVSNVSDFSSLFKDSDINEDISRWNTSSATAMNEMFYMAPFFNQDISRWDVSSVGTMEAMFSRAQSFNQDISRWDVSSVTTMSAMFNGAKAFNQNLSKWDVSSVLTMYAMFQFAAVFNGDISSWNTSSVTSMSWMFFDATIFNGDISKWDISSVTTLGGMFQNAGRFNGDISLWDTSSVKDMSYMFSGAASFNQDISRWNISSVITMENMFYDAASFNQSLPGWAV